MAIQVANDGLDILLIHPVYLGLVISKTFSYPLVDVLIPAYNEGQSISKVIQALRLQDVREIIVCNNGSTDNTALMAQDAGATVIHSHQLGYGHACLSGIAYLRSKPITQQPDIVVFIDGDFSDYPEELPLLIEPIIRHDFDLVIGSRITGNAQHGSLTPQQIFGNRLATLLIRWLYGYHFTDLGPFRAIRWHALLRLDMQDKTYGWTVEMQVKAAKQKLRCTEVPVSYRKRIGQSKVSGTVKGVIGAGHKILWTIFKLR